VVAEMLEMPEVAAIELRGIPGNVRMFQTTPPPAAVKQPTM
jgi:hypothetical protein